MANDCNLDKRQVKDIKYLNKDFGTFRADLIKFAKSYFPETYNDFNESSPGMMFIEMASYVGDVLSYYVDDQLKESLLMHAEERANVVDLARALGYKTKPVCPSIVNLCVYQVVPVESTSGEPDLRYALQVGAGMEAKTEDNKIFLTQEQVDFKQDTGRKNGNRNIYIWSCQEV